jgi:hypothetical protein
MQLRLTQWLNRSLGCGFRCLFYSVKLKVWLFISFPASTNCPFVLLQIFRVRTVSILECKICIQWIAPSKLMRVQLVYCIWRSHRLCCPVCGCSPHQRIVYNFNLNRCFHVPAHGWILNVGKFIVEICERKSAWDRLLKVAFVGHHVCCNEMF